MQNKLINSVKILTFFPLFTRDFRLIETFGVFLFRKQNIFDFLWQLRIYVPYVLAANSSETKNIYASHFKNCYNFYFKILITVQRHLKKMKTLPSWIVNNKEFVYSHLPGKWNFEIFLGHKFLILSYWSCLNINCFYFKMCLIKLFFKIFLCHFVIKNKNAFTYFRMK